MKIRGKNNLIVLALILSWFFPKISFSLSYTESLQGLKGVEVIVEELKAELEDYNLSPIQIQKEVETLLQNSGVQVLSREDNEKKQPFRKPYLHIKVNSFKLPLKKPYFAYCIEIALNQQVKLLGNEVIKKTYLFSPTWYKSELGAEVGKDVPRIIEVIKKLIEKFINDYKAANPNL
ncbi:MAG: hypothetical protein ACPL5I_12660 [Thermodesulfobacteriota bacterium]